MNYLFLILPFIILFAGCNEEMKTPIVVIETNMGNIEMELYPNVAPKTVESFLKLTNSGFYNGLIFHRVVKGFVIQGGDPKGDGSGGPGYNVPAEFSTMKHEPGIVAMARRGDDINSAGSQFYICLNTISHLDGQYTIFGKVISGMDVVYKIGDVQVNQMSRPMSPVTMNKVYIKK